MPQFRRLDDDAIVTVSGDEALASFTGNPAYAPYVAPKPEPPVDDLDSRTKAELDGYAVEHGIDLTAAKTKADMVAAIRAHFAALPDRQDDDNEGQGDSTPDPA